RRQLEGEARGKLIRLRAEYAAAAGDGAVLAELLVRALGTFVVMFRAGLRVAGRPVPGSAAEIIRAAGAAAGFDAAPFETTLAARRMVPASPLEPHDPLAAAYLSSIERFVSWVDGL